jgi:hypoxanthine phosphoribosyltransferase
MAKEKVSFEQVSEMCRLLSNRVKRDHYHPDLIIGVSRGGWIPARLVSDYLKVNRLASVGLSSYEKDKKKGRPKLVERLGVRIRRLEVLVVEDIVDTGDSLEVLDAYLKRLGPKEVRYVALHCKPWAKTLPDYFYRKTSAWKVYPWEKKEFPMP